MLLGPPWEEGLTRDPLYRLYTLGRLELAGPERSAADSLLRGPKRVALLAYLAAAEPTAFLRRDSLVALLWPKLDQGRARHALRNTLHSLRKVLGRDSIKNRGRDEIAIDEERLWCDVSAFEAALDQGRFREAVELYGGEFLHAFHVPDVAPAFEHWMHSERSRLAHGFRAALEQVAEECTARGGYRDAAELWRRLARHEPLNERFVLSLMTCLVAAGDPSAALREADAHIEWLRQEYDAGAPATVVELALALRRGDHAVLGTHSIPGFDGSAPSAGAASSSEPPSSAGQGVGPAARSNELRLVGRRSEWRRLQAAWTAAAGGSAGFATISGVAGIGKTRLAEEHQLWVEQNGFTHAAARCYAVEGRLAYGPVAEWLRSESLRPGVARLRPVWLTEVARIVPELLHGRPDVQRPAPLTESWQRRRLFEALARGILSAPQPLSLFLDDLQWCDLETLDWMRFLIRFAPAARLLIVGTVRDDELGPNQPWKRLSLALRESGQLTNIPLESLDRSETATLASLVAAEELDEPQADRVFGETEGNPLFVVEAVRAGLLDPDDGRSDPLLSPRVQAVIEYRLSQLSERARALAELAATVGHPFSATLLAEAGTLGEEALAEALDELWRRRIIRRGTSGAYDFSHDKLREVAYGRVGPARRAVLHRRIAEALKAIHTPNLDPVSSRLAVHYEQAGSAGVALDYYEQAAGVAQKTHADEEVVRLLTRALALLKSLPPGEREARELKLLLALGSAAASARGWAAPEAGEAFHRASRIVRRLGGRAGEAARTAWGVHAFHVVRGDIRRARSEGAEVWDHVRDGDDPLVLPAIRFNQAMALFHAGELEGAGELLEQIVNDPGFAEQCRRSRPLPLGSLTLSYLAHVSWHLGNEAAALERSAAANRLASDQTDPFEHAIALAYAAMLHQFRGDVGAVREDAEAAWAVCDRYGIPYYRAWASILRGWARGAEGDAMRGMEQLDRGLADLLATGGELRRPYYLGLMADLSIRAEEPARGLTFVTRALEIAHAKGEIWCVPELLRLQGRLLEIAGRDRQAERSFRQALERARELGARPVAVRVRAALRARTVSRRDPPDRR